MGYTRPLGCAPSEAARGHGYCGGDLTKKKKSEEECREANAAIIALKILRYATTNDRSSTYDPAAAFLTHLNFVQETSAAMILLRLFLVALCRDGWSFFFASSIASCVLSFPHAP